MLFKVLIKKIKLMFCFHQWDEYDFNVFYGYSIKRKCIKCGVKEARIFIRQENNTMYYEWKRIKDGY